jgi:RNA recognition motif-containing protein
MQTAAARKKLLIGNLPDRTPRTDVEKYFGVIGPVLSVALVRNGFGFVEMESADADRARLQLNGRSFNGRPMMVDEAHPRQSSRT